ncbi:MAG: hypothetical protein Q7T71_20760 [Herbiconiux sp.]|nr:hypothetical protein [Herbiconiux sp.]
MGTLFYGGDSRFELDDRLLAHLQVVIGLKLRRSERFYISWVVPAGEGGGRTVLWIDNGVSLRLRYDGTRPPTVNREWIETLVLSANTPNGLVVTPESIEPGPPRTSQPGA